MDDRSGQISRRDALRMALGVGAGLALRPRGLRAHEAARLDLYTQVTTLVLQGLVAGHLMKRLGVHVTLALLPITAVLGFAGLAAAASLVTLTVFQAAFSAVQRSLTRPARETLVTVVPRAEKYEAKAFIDTFVYRGGDVVGAQVPGLLGRLAAGLGALVAVTVPLTLAWAALGVWLGRAQQPRVAERPRPAAAPETAVAV